ncbi:multisubunit potassium/proton antiporter PhaE subunit [Cupriavidus gilardii J11]|uniref:Multisubunit potassium/proton antiporter PhaE subunit n=1 Tax=Cupriavidus gilardii J11 TaxID=936133 RepID=A0A562BP42_9BURK|nr:Na+/H+ antiporter subunit E [Cupriavidus gilardii]TWG87045.1 multisubunit potassium/proton antiporter PhaE subunit [Cupriavidus gilardii J11]
MMRRLFPHPWLSLLLLALWLLLNNAASVGHWLLGVLLAWAIGMRIGSRLWLSPVRLRRPGLALRLALHVAADIVMANIHVAWLVLRPSGRLRPAFVEVPLEPGHEIGLAALISIVSLSPGTLCADLSDDRRCLLIHVLDLDDERGLIARIKARYEAPLLEIFVCSTS